MRSRQGRTFEYHVQFRAAACGHRKIANPQPLVLPIEPGRVPRVARLLALAHHFEELVQRGEIGSYAEIARLGHVSRARMAQIMKLLLLSPDIQEKILFLPRKVKGRARLAERHLRRLVAEPDWTVQRKIWKTLVGDQPSLEATLVGQVGDAVDRGNLGAPRRSSRL